MNEAAATLDAFQAWLTSRRIDPEALLRQYPEVYQQWQTLFGQMHPESFAAQIRFQINAVRRSLQGLPALHTAPSPVGKP
ncbi:hypothetical protein WDZ92_01160 [Nostoc sp. NIES-2111]